MTTSTLNGFCVGGVLDRAKPAMIALCGALAVGGCSANITRFETPGFRLSDDGATGSLAQRGSGESTLSGQSPSRSYGGGYSPPPRSGSSVRTAALPDVSPVVEPARPARTEQRFSAPPAATPPATAIEQAETGDVIEVESGDTLYGLSRRHGVSIAELMSANGLTSSLLKPGQKLQLPSGVSAVVATSERRPPEPATETRPSAAPADWTGSHTVVPGESLYSIARRHNIGVGELQRNNGIEDPRRMRPGYVLKVPGSAGGGPSLEPVGRPSRYAAAPADTATDAAPSSTPPAAKGVRTVAIDPATRASGPRSDPVPAVAPSQPAPVAAARPPVSSMPTAAKSDKLRWPARGRIIGGFGPKSDGTHNDGVNLAVPMGTEVHSAEDGVVAYAGSELRGYGNLILVRHDNGWVTAYAHNSELVVKRGDSVKRGQVIAKSGKTGDVDQPQLHFELRQGSKPVDPLPHLESL